MKKSKSLILNSLLGSIILANTLSAGDINATQQKLTANNGAINDYFGSSVALNNNYAIVGAMGDDSKGSAYLYELNATDINASQIKLTASDRAMSDSFGYSVAVNNNYAIVGASNDDSYTGSVYLYELNATDINASQIKLTASDRAINDYFGSSVAISGNYVIVAAKADDDGASDSGSVYLYELNATDINASQIKLTANDGAGSDYFGYSVAMKDSYAIVGAKGDDNNKGSAYLFELNATNINASQRKLTASDGAGSDYFGYSVAMKDSYAIVGAKGDDNKGSAYLFELNATDINASQIKLSASDRANSDNFGSSVAISGNYVIVGVSGDDDGASGSGSAYMFELNATDINASQRKLTANDGTQNASFGYSVAMKDSYAIVGAKGDANKGSAYLFDLNNSLPTVSNVQISGTVNIGETLTGSYDYSDGNSDSESGSTYKWYMADDNLGTNAEAISGATSKTYTITMQDGGKYLVFGVTPKDGKGFGSEVNSSYTIDMVPVKVDFNSSIVTANSWNMVTVPNERNVSVSNISGATVWTFNNSTNAWEKPTTLTAGKGYLLYTSSPIGLVSADKVSSTITDDNTTIKNIENNNTWTLVGISKSTSGFSWSDIYNPNNTLKSDCYYTQIFYYDSANSSWNTSSNIPYLAGVWVKQNCPSGD